MTDYALRKRDIPKSALLHTEIRAGSEFRLSGGKRTILALSSRVLFRKIRWQSIASFTKDKVAWQGQCDDWAHDLLSDEKSHNKRGLKFNVGLGGRYSEKGQEKLKKKDFNSKRSVSRTLQTTHAMDESAILEMNPIQEFIERHPKGRALITHDDSTASESESTVNLTYNRENGINCSCTKENSLEKKNKGANGAIDREQGKQNLVRAMIKYMMENERSLWEKDKY